MRLSSQRRLVRRSSLFAVGFAAAALAACGSQAGNEVGAGAGGASITLGGGGAAAGAAPAANAGGMTSPGSGGVQGPTASSGGATGPAGGAGGAQAVGGGSSGGSAPAGGAAGSSTAGAAGMIGGAGAAGAAGASGAAGAAGAGGGPALADCDLRTGSSKNVITQACGHITTPTGKSLDLGPYGAVMDVNVGKGFENTQNPADAPGSPSCASFTATFGEDPKITAQLLDIANLDFKLYTVYRPAKWPDGKIPVLSWGNGTCAAPEGYGSLLRYVASNGYVVVAANSRFTGSGAEIKHGIDFMAAAATDASSPYSGHLDMTKVGIMGHSQGSQGTTAASSDARVGYVILFNLGVTASKPFLAISGDQDITGYSAASMATAINGAPKAAYAYFHNPVGMGSLKGHLVLMMSPERVTDLTVNWWNMFFKGDMAAHDFFVGTSCGACGHATDYNYGEHGL